MLTPRLASYSILEIDVPGREPFVAGVLLLDLSSKSLFLRLRRDWEQTAPEESLVLRELEDDLRAKAREMGGEAVLEYLEQTLSNVVRIADRREIEIADPIQTLGRLYREHVRSTVQPFVTHIPR